MAYTTVDPIRKYETPTGVATIQAAYFASIVAADQLVIAGVAGKRIRVMGWIAQAVAGAVGTFSLQTGAGGAGVNLMGFLTVPPVTAGLNDKLPIVDTGYFETVTGEGLYVDVVNAAINFTIFYIIYTP